MECVAGLQPRTADPIVGERRDQLLQILRRTGQHSVQTVVGCYRHPWEIVRNVLDVLGVCEYRHHAAPLGQVAEEPSAFGNQSNTILEAEHPRDAGRGD